MNYYDVTLGSGSPKSCHGMTCSGDGNIRIVAPDGFVFDGTVGNLVKALKLGKKAAFIQADAAASAMGAQLLVTENDRLCEQLINVGQVCKAAKEEIEYLQGLQAGNEHTGAAYVDLAEENERLKARIERYRELDEISLEFKKHHQATKEENERLKADYKRLSESLLGMSRAYSELKSAMSKALRDF